MSATIPQTVTVKVSFEFTVESYGVTTDDAIERVSRRYDFSARELSDIVELINSKGFTPKVEIFVDNGDSF